MLFSNNNKSTAVEMRLIKIQIQLDMKNVGRDTSELSTIYKYVLKMSGMSLIT